MRLAGAALGFPTIIPSRVLGADAPSKKINILQIAAGRIGRNMDIPGILRHDSTRLVALCDLDLNAESIGVPSPSARHPSIRQFPQQV